MVCVQKILNKKINNLFLSWKVIKDKMKKSAIITIAVVL